MLYIIGLGLGDERDITVRGLEAVKTCDKVYMEAYTSLLSFGLSTHGLSNLVRSYLYHLFPVINFLRFELLFHFISILIMNRKNCMVNRSLLRTEKWQKKKPITFSPKLAIPMSPSSLLATLLGMYTVCPFYYLLASCCWNIFH